MEGWMIALIVVASVLVVLVAAYIAGSCVAFRLILCRHKPSPKYGTAEQYGVDIPWFDTVADATDTVEITSFDGIKLRAIRIKHDVAAEAPASKVALLIHGYCAGPRSMQPFARIFLERGFDVIMPAQRAHGESEGKHIGMGWLERFDVMRWLEKAVELYGKDVSIALMGESMGGASVIAASGMDPIPQIKCVIDDCGFSSQTDEYYYQLKKVPLPKAVALSPLALAVRFVQGYSVYEADFVQFAERSKLPTLFIHGEKDTFVPCECGKKMYEACGAEDKRLELFDAGHAGSFVSDRERYTRILTEFVDKYIPQ